MTAHNPSISPPGEADELELELRRVRSKAEAARFEAQAAEIELLLRKSARTALPPPPADTFDQLKVNDWQELLAAAAATLPTKEASAKSPQENGTSFIPPTADRQPAATRNRRAKQEASTTAGPRPASQKPSGPAPISPSPVSPSPVSPSPVSPSPISPSPISPSPPRRARTTKGATTKGATIKRTPPKAATTRGSNVQASAALKGAERRVDPVADGRGRAGVRSLRLNEPASAKSGGAGDVRRRKRPAAWIVSSVAHAAVLLLLAAMTISVTEPVEQITLDAAPPQSAEESLETVVFEQSVEPEAPARLSEVNPVAELSSLGTILGSETEIETPEILAPSPSTLERLHHDLGTESLTSANLSTAPTSEFFGAEGGGNHFVYLVDNSGSMAGIARNGFDVARRELLKSIDALHDEQRFYVIFFGEEVLRMRLRDPAKVEPRSVYATAANKAAVRRWAMGITMQPGRWPQKALEVAFELRPDVIFLLTDGEMSQRAEPMIRQHNLVENLFAGPHPRSIIHTIGFYSRDGAEQMQTIARVNGGTYHFVPPPK